MAASTNELVQDVLESVKKQFKSITVEKDIEVDVDCGNLLVCDQNPIDIKLYRFVHVREFILLTLRRCLH